MKEAARFGPLLFDSLAIAVGMSEEEFNNITSVDDMYAALEKHLGLERFDPAQPARCRCRGHPEDHGDRREAEAKRKVNPL